MDLKKGQVLLSAGSVIAWACETEAGERPTSAKAIPDVKSMPAFDAEPEKIDVTDLSAEQYKAFINGLIDLSGASQYGVNVTKLLIKEWKGLYNAWKTAKASGKATWFFIKSPGLQTVAFPGEPGAMPIPGREVNAALTGNVTITVSGEPQWLDENDEITVTYPQSD